MTVLESAVKAVRKGGSIFLGDLRNFELLEALHTSVELHRSDSSLSTKELQKQIQTPICLDESIHSAEDARKAIEIGACRIINIKLGRVGGHKEARAVHDVCRDHGVPVWCGGMLESGIGRAHNIALSSLENFSLPGDVTASKRYWAEDIIDPEVTVTAQGTIRVPHGPGLGFVPNLERIERATMRKESFEWKGLRAS